MRSPRVVSFAHRIVAAAAIVVPILQGCRVVGNDVVRVRVVFSAADQNRELTNLTAVAGGDKYSWETLRAGSEKRINLVPGPQDDRQLLFSYTLDGQQRYWQGPKVDAGTGYEIAMTIDGNGTVSASHCTLPCTAVRPSAKPAP